ncbi:MAG: hypothetical protein WCE72_11965, partial [Pseudolabrys sp.]
QRAGHLVAVTADVRFGHLADNQTAPAFVRYWTKADKGAFWQGTARPLCPKADICNNPASSSVLV